MTTPCSFLRRVESREGLSTMVARARVINDTYSTLIPDVAVWEMLFSVFPPDAYPEIAALSREYTGHHVVSELLLRYYPAERVVKYHLVKERIGQPDEVTIFEMYVDTSRVDLARINGKSYAFEVKTEFDRLDRLPRQMEDYAKVFEHVSAVVHESHLERALDLVPEFCGVQVYTIAESGIDLCTIRPPEPSKMVTAEAQVRNLSSKDLAEVLRQVGLPDPRRRDERAALVLRECDPEQVNVCFKAVLKRKYQKQWDYLQSIFDQIEPIDIQAFYRTEADPKWVYYKYSSIVYR
ncbi:sce7726 family protein [Symbiobacterium thermophilum]|uniref:sce7726 family protein n=1 Tax=Symbiobacterium thermophilum TaxID=2734 RepID=UPI0035C71952